MQAVRDYLVKTLKKYHTNEPLRCTGCLEDIPARKLYTAPCKHQYCPPCLRRMALVALDNLEIFPPKCCQKEIPMEGIVSVMSSRNKKRYVSRWQEKTVPPQDRIYCPRATCGRWIHPDSKGTRPGTQLCPHCRAKVCSACRDFAHGPWPCSESDIQDVLRMMKINKWRRCSKCYFVVEKVGGCNHIRCRCGNDFCYMCGASGRRNRCECPTEDQTDEVAPVEDLDVGTVVAAMEQTHFGDNLSTTDDGY